MKYIRLFEQHSEYAAAESGLTLPNVSHCVRENDVHYKNLVFGTITVTFNVTNNEAYIIGNNQYEAAECSEINLYDSSFLSIEVDGEPFSEERLTECKKYTFPTNGTHTVVYKVKDGVLGENALCDLDKATDVVLGKDVVEIKSGSLSSEFNSITFLNDNTKIECGAIYVNEDTPYENNIQYFGPVAGRVSGSSSITSYVIKEGTKIINPHFCQEMGWVTGVTIPSTIERICNEVFFESRNLRSVVINATTPPSIGEHVFDYVDFNEYTYEEEYRPLDVTIYVPSGSVNAYKTAPGWSDYASKIQAIP